MIPYIRGFSFEFDDDGEAAVTIHLHQWADEREGEFSDVRLTVGACNRNLRVYVRDATGRIRYTRECLRSSGDERHDLDCPPLFARGWSYEVYADDRLMFAASPNQGQRGMG